MTDFLSGFTRDPSWKPIDCPCGWKGSRGDLVKGQAVEKTHPKNQGKGPDDPDLYQTQTEGQENGRPEHRPRHL